MRVFKAQTKKVRFLAFVGLRGWSAMGVLFLFYAVSLRSGVDGIAKYSLVWAFCFIGSIFIRLGAEVLVLRDVSGAASVASLRIIKTAVFVVLLRAWLVIPVILLVAYSFGSLDSAAMKWGLVAGSLMCLCPLFSFYLRGRGNMLLSVIPEYGVIAWLMGSDSVLIAIAGHGFLDVIIFGMVLGSLLFIAFFLMARPGIEWKSWSLFITKSQLLNSFQGWGMVAVSPFFLSTFQISVFSVLSRVNQVPSLVLQTLNIVYAPKYANASKERDLAGLISNWAECRKISVLTVLGFAALLVPLINVIASAFSISEGSYYIEFSSMILGHFFVALSGGALMLFNMSNNENKTFFIMLCAVAGQFAFIFLFGFIGSLWVYCASFSVFNFVVMVMAYSRLRVEFQGAKE